MAGPDRIYWDSCCFISWLNDEERPKPDKDGLNACALAFQKKDIILITSTITHTEVTETKVTADGLKKFEDFLQRSDVDCPPPVLAE